MNFNKWVHVDSVIEKVSRDYEINSFSRDDAKEWAWECMGKMGVPSLLKDASCIVEINNYKGVLPPDFYEMVSARTYIDKVILNETAYEFWQDYAGYKDTNKTVSDGYNSFTMVSDEYNNWESPANVLIGNYTSGTTGLPVRLKYVYKIDGDYIHVGFPDTTIEVAYKAIPMYNDGSPMIPDDERIKYAIEATIIYKVIQREWVKGNATIQMKNEIEREYLFAIGSGRNKALTPSNAEWEAMKNRAMAIIKSHKGFDQSNALFGMRNTNYLDKSV